MRCEYVVELVRSWDGFLEDGCWLGGGGVRGGLEGWGY